MARQALGKGLQALIGDADTTTGDLRNIPVGEIIANPYQPRLVFDDQELAELADSVRRQGILQPITVRQAKNTGYELISGERRWRAAKLAGLAEVPALVRRSDNAESLELALVENLQRKDLNPLEAAQAYQRMINEFRLSQEQVATRVGKERSSVANTLRLLNLPTVVQEQLLASQLSMGHAKVLMSLSRPDQQVNTANKVIAEGLSVRQLETVIERMRTQPSAPDHKSAQAEALEEQLQSHLSTRVVVQEGKRSGRIEIRYKNAEERKRIAALLLGQG